MSRHKEGGDSALRYYNKLVVQLKGRGYSDAQAESTALAAMAKRYENYGEMTVAHKIVEAIMAKRGINKIFYAVYFSFVNAYLKQVKLGNPYKAEQVVKAWVEKGADKSVLSEITSKLGEVIA